MIWYQRAVVVLWNLIINVAPGPENANDQLSFCSVIALRPEEKDYNDMHKEEGSFKQGLIFLLLNPNQGAILDTNPDLLGDSPVLVPGSQNCAFCLFFES